MKQNTKNILIFGILFLLADLILKIIISDRFILNENYILIKNLLSLRLVYNTGAAFSILEGNRILLILISFIVLIFIYLYVNKEEYMDSKDILIYSLLIGGIFGNLLDRIIHGYVIDYISFTFGSYSFPIFNFADICITISIALILLTTLKGDLWKE